MVRSTVERVLAERELDDCPLAIQELSAIEDAFVQVLVGVHHRRIKYPPAQVQI
jgi:membrane-associated HD superfamily phosphohydrolase